MSAPRYSISTGKISSGGLTTGSTKSLCLVNPVTNGINISEIWISAGAIAAQTDIAWEIYRVTTIGSAAGTTATVVKDDPNEAAADATGLINLTTEPTAVEKLRELYLPVNQGFFVFPYPLGREVEAAAAGQRLGYRIVNDEAGTMTAVNFRSTVVWEVGA